MFTEFDKSLINELESVPISRENVKTLIKYGADINAEDKYECLMENVIGYYPYEKAEFLPEVVKVAIENGWNTAKQGLRVIRALVFSTGTKECFYAAKLILENGVNGTEGDFNDALETISTEESYQRCCDHNTEKENLYYAMYELVDATKQGKSIKEVEHFNSALGMTVDKIVCFGEENFIRKQSALNITCIGCNVKFFGIAIFKNNISRYRRYTFFKYNTSVQRIKKQAVLIRKSQSRCFK